MSNVTPQAVKELRDRTGVGMSKCKEALDQAHGDMEKAIEILRKAGMASAVKKEGREAKEGFIAYKETKEVIAVLEVNCETDFVARNERFQKFLQELTAQVAELKISDLKSFMDHKSKNDSSISNEQYRNLLVQALGENIQVSRLKLISKKPISSYGIYSHMDGKIVSIVELCGGSGEEVLARDIAMHVAAESPEYLKSDDVPEVVREKEKEIARALIKGKPENMIEKILAGKLQAYYDQVCLLNQKYVKDSQITIQELVAAKAKETNKPLSIGSFWRWKVGN